MGSHPFEVPQADGAEQSLGWAKGWEESTAEWDPEMVKDLPFLLKEGKGLHVDGDRCH